MIAGREVTLSGDDDGPDRYGRQPAFVHLAGTDASVQGMLLAQGEALVSADVVDKDRAASLLVPRRPRRAGPSGEPGRIRRS